MRLINESELRNIRTFNNNDDKKYSENTDQSTSVTFDLDLTSKSRTLFHHMSLLVSYLDTRHRRNEFTSYENLTFCSIFIFFYLDKRSLKQSKERV